MTLTTTSTENYELLDFGEGYKLERFGEYILARPDSQALGQKMYPSLWDKVHAVFDGEWVQKQPMPENWVIEFQYKFALYLSPFRHVGVFPEQSQQWDWIEEIVGGRPLKILNLFGYTGGATMAALKAGALVTHVDASKKSLTQMTENLVLNGLREKPVRIMYDDALSFVAREARRDNVYDAIILDPPEKGHGKDGEVWNINRDLPKLLKFCSEILTKEPAFILLNGYVNQFKVEEYHAMLLESMKSYQGHVLSGDLNIAQTQGDRNLPAGFFARWMPH